MKPLVIANWKMNPLTLKEAKILFRKIKNLGAFKKVKVIICPPFIYLSELSSRKSNIKLGGQNCFWEDQGAFTGEISPLMLKNLGCQYVIIGHSERRKLLNEANLTISKKIKTALANNLTPILCIGETKEEKNNAQKIIKTQLENSLKRINKKNIKDIILAYEPIWAIGTGKACSAEEARVMRLLLEKIISQKYSRSIAKGISILYGGSVNSSNVTSFIKEAGFQGVLVGGASLKPKEFIDLVRNI